MIAICSLQDEVDGVINVCTGEPESLSSRVERFIQANGFPIQLEYGAFPDRPYDSPGVWGGCHPDSCHYGKMEEGAHLIIHLSKSAYPLKSKQRKRRLLRGAALLYGGVQEKTT